MATQYFTRVPEHLFEAVKSGELSLFEFGVLVYMMGGADMNTAILESSSTILASEIHVEVDRVRNCMQRLVQKKRLQIVPSKNKKAKHKLQESKKAALRAKQTSSKKRWTRKRRYYINDYMKNAKAALRAKQTSSNSETKKQSTSCKNFEQNSPSVDPQASTGILDEKKNDRSKILNKEQLSSYIVYKSQEACQDDKIFNKNEEKKQGTPEQAILRLMNKICGSMWSPQSASHMENLAELAAWPVADVEAALKKALKSQPTLKPPGAIAYILKILLNDQEEKEAAPRVEKYDQRVADVKAAKHAVSMYRHTVSTDNGRSVNMLDSSLKHKFAKYGAAFGAEIGMSYDEFHAIIGDDEYSDH